MDQTHKAIIDDIVEKNNISFDVVMELYTTICEKNIWKLLEVIREKNCTHKGEETHQEAQVRTLDDSSMNALFLDELFLKEALAVMLTVDQPSPPKLSGIYHGRTRQTSSL